MGNILYIIAVFLVICWFIGFFILDIGSLIHILLILSLILILIRISRDK
jgi:hypothetical protein